MQNNSFLKRLPIDVGTFQRFFQNEVGGSLPLFLAAAIALVWGDLSPATPGKRPPRLGDLPDHLLVLPGQFTMSLFISGLAFTDPGLLESAKRGILTASLGSAIIGAMMLWRR